MSFPPFPFNFKNLNVQAEHRRVKFETVVSSFFIITPTCTQSITKLILKLKLLRHVLVLLHHPQGALNFCQLKLWNY